MNRYFIHQVIGLSYSISCHIFSFCFFILAQASISYASPSKITGFFLKDKASEPLPGALIALYEANSNFLVDHTFTTENGQFTLKDPQSSGKFYIVATKDKFVDKVDFEYNPQKPPSNIMIRHKETKSSLDPILGYLGKQLDYTVTSLLGFFLGIGYQSLQNRGRAKQALVIRLQDLRSYKRKILDTRNNLQYELGYYQDNLNDPSKRDEHRTKCSNFLIEIKNMACKLLQAIEFNDETIYMVYGQSGIDHKLRLREALQNINKLSDTPIQDILDSYVRKSEIWRNLKKSFEPLESNIFLKSEEK